MNPITKAISQITNLHYAQCARAIEELPQECLSVHVQTFENTDEAHPKLLMESEIHPSEDKKKWVSRSKQYTQTLETALTNSQECRIRHIFKYIAPPSLKEIFRESTRARHIQDCEEAVKNAPPIEGMRTHIETYMLNDDGSEGPTLFKTVLLYSKSKQQDEKPVWKEEESSEGEHFNKILSTLENCPSTSFIPQIRTKIFRPKLTDLFELVTCSQPSSSPPPVDQEAPSYLGTHINTHEVKLLIDGNTYGIEYEGVFYKLPEGVDPDSVQQEDETFVCSDSTKSYKLVQDNAFMTWKEQSNPLDERASNTEKREYLTSHTNPHGVTFLIDGTTYGIEHEGFFYKLPEGVDPNSIQKESETFVCSDSTKSYMLFRDNAFMTWKEQSGQLDERVSNTENREYHPSYTNRHGITFFIDGNTWAIEHEGYFYKLPEGVNPSSITTIDSILGFQKPLQATSLAKDEAEQNPIDVVATKALTAHIKTTITDSDDDLPETPSDSESEQGTIPPLENSLPPNHPASFGHSPPPFFPPQPPPPFTGFPQPPPPFADFPGFAPNGFGGFPGFDPNGFGGFPGFDPNGFGGLPHEFPGTSGLNGFFPHSSPQIDLFTDFPFTEFDTDQINFLQNKPYNFGHISSLSSGKHILINEALNKIETSHRIELPTIKKSLDAFLIKVNQQGRTESLRQHLHTNSTQNKNGMQSKASLTLSEQITRHLDKLEEIYQEVQSIKESLIETVKSFKEASPSTTDMRRDYIEKISEMENHLKELSQQQAQIHENLNLLCQKDIEPQIIRKFSESRRMIAQSIPSANGAHELKPAENLHIIHTETVKDLREDELSKLEEQTTAFEDYTQNELKSAENLYIIYTETVKDLREDELSKLEEQITTFEAYTQQVKELLKSASTTQGDKLFLLKSIKTALTNMLEILENPCDIDEKISNLIILNDFMRCSIKCCNSSIALDFDLKQMQHIRLFQIAVEEIKSLLSLEKQSPLGIVQQKLKSLKSNPNHSDEDLEQVYKHIERLLNESNSIADLIVVAEELSTQVPLLKREIAQREPIRYTALLEETNRYCETIKMEIKCQMSFFQKKNKKQLIENYKQKIEIINTLLTYNPANEELLSEITSVQNQIEALEEEIKKEELEEADWILECANQSIQKANRLLALEEASPEELTSHMLDAGLSYSQPPEEIPTKSAIYATILKDLLLQALQNQLGALETKCKHLNEGQDVYEAKLQEIENTKRRILEEESKIKQEQKETIDSYLAIISKSETVVDARSDLPQRFVNGIFFTNPSITKEELITSIKETHLIPLMESESTIKCPNLEAANLVRLLRTQIIDEKIQSSQKRIRNLERILHVISQLNEQGYTEDTRTELETVCAEFPYYSPIITQSSEKEDLKRILYYISTTEQQLIQTTLKATIDIIDLISMYEDDAFESESTLAQTKNGPTPEWCAQANKTCQLMKAHIDSDRAYQHSQARLPTQAQAANRVISPIEQALTKKIGQLKALLEAPIKQDLITQWTADLEQEPQEQANAEEMIAWIKSLQINDSDAMRSQLASLEQQLADVQMQSRLGNIKELAQEEVRTKTTGSYILSIKVGDTLVEEWRVEADTNKQSLTRMFTGPFQGEPSYELKLIGHPF